MPVAHHESRFNPYTDNGGTVVAIAGNNYCIVAADTRQSEGYSINARYVPKTHQLTPTSVLAYSGFSADGVRLCSVLKAQVTKYKFAHEKYMTTPSLAQTLSAILYGKRFFPYYVFNVLGGLDENGVGAVYSYDPVGSFEREGFRAAGSASNLVQPFLDNQIGKKNQNNPDKSPISVEDAVKIVKDAFHSAAERDIYTGDYLLIHIIKKEGTTTEKVQLRKD